MANSKEPSSQERRSNFFKADDNLDIVGALNNLNLDEDINYPRSLTPNNTVTNSMGALTPKPNNFEVGGFTPWSTANFIPQLAPPFIYNHGNDLNEKLPKPFELPESTVNFNNKGLQNLNLPFSTPPPMSQAEFKDDLVTRSNSTSESNTPDYLNNYNLWQQVQVQQINYRDRYRKPNGITNNNGNGFNESMNIHRKLHNNPNRRKGDDASKYMNAKLEDFQGEIYSLCKDQHGCRFLQRQLDLSRDIENQNTHLSNDLASTLIFNEIYLKIVELMIDPFGNYLIQKLFENVNVDQRIILVKNAASDFIRIALDPHGTRALQKLIECVSTDEESTLIIHNLSPHIVSLSRDLNGNHVVQKCLQKLNPKDNQFIFDIASLNCNEIATHRHGCCVLQRCLDYGGLSQRKQLSLKIAENATNLSLDPFGNYVVQYVLSRGDPTSIDLILNHIKTNFVLLSLHKFGSNVIEKSLRISALSKILINVLLDNTSHFPDLLNDPFGNYVLQTSLDVAQKPELFKLSQALHPLLPNIRNTPHGRRILSKVQSIVV